MQVLTSRKIVRTFPHIFPLAFAMLEYMRRWAGILLQALRLFPDSIQMITSGMQSWGSMARERSREM